jgi:endonuclease/exonuclease/phosphatase family metal-dependent hydrolase
MPLELLTRGTTLGGQQVREPTLLAFAVGGVGIALLLVLVLAGIVGLPAVGYLGWSFAVVAVVQAWLIWGLRGKLKPGPASLTGRQRSWHRLLKIARVSFIGVLGCWLALIAWLAACPGEAAPVAKAEPALIRVVSWNIHCGQDHGPPWKRFDWPARKQPLHAALDSARPEILCVQEATPAQVTFLEEALPAHRRVGVGRDDGKSEGEHCAIYFDRQRFEELGGSTFWLEEPIDQPRPGGALDVKRICTWVRLRDRVSGRTLRVYNTHLPLTEAPRRTAAQVILDQIAAGDRADAILVTADFNSTPASPSRQLFRQAGLVDSAELAGQAAGQATLQLYGIGVRSIDAILLDARWRVQQHRVLKVKPQNVFPSDHFGLLADVALAE